MCGRLELGEGAAPDERFNARSVILQRKARMLRCVDAPVAGNLAAHPHIAERIFHYSLQRGGYFEDRKFLDVGG